MRSDDRQRRAHRRHLRRSLRHARDRADHHRRHCALGAPGGADSMTGFATSVIGCGCEAGIDRELAAKRDAGRAAGRARSCCLRSRPPSCRSSFGPASGNACSRARARPVMPGSTGEERSSSAMRCAISATAGRFPSGFGAKHYWRIPVMDGEFVCEATTGLTKQAVGGGNLLILGRTARSDAAPRPKPPSAAIAECPT